MARVRGITWKVLSENLKKLESFGLVERGVAATRPVRVRYGLTSRGRSLTGWLVRNGIM
jgi:DNA-binding HxlR family transcriptional regulator